MRKIIVHVPADPEEDTVTVTTEGFDGPACLEATAELERALGDTVAEERTPEFYERQDDIRLAQER